MDKIIEPQAVKLSDVREALIDTIRWRQIRLMQQDTLQRLVRAARIEYVNPSIRRQAQESGLK